MVVRVVKRLYAALAALALVLVAVTGVAHASQAPAPQNEPNGRVQFVINQSEGGWNWYVGGGGIMILSQSFSYFQSTYITAEGAWEIKLVGGSLGGHCLGWDQSGGYYAVRANVACNPTATWDLWAVGSNNDYSVVTTLYNNNNGDCVWVDGLGDVLQPFGCSGNNGLDRFQFVDKVQG